MKNKVLILFILIICMISCVQHKTFIESDDLTCELIEYYDYCLQYPNTVEQYCSYRYKRDSVGKFNFLTEFVPDSNELLAVSSQDQYLYLFDSFAQKNNIEAFEYSPIYYLQKYRNDITFSENDSALCVNTSSKSCFLYGKKLVSFISYYDGVTSLESYPLNVCRSLRKMERIALYGYDMKKILVCENDLDKIQQGIRNHFSKNMADDTGNIQRYVVLYSRDGKMRDLISNRSVPSYIVNDSELKCYLDSVIGKFSSASYLRFYYEK